jgi:hypothetical protein
VINIAGSTGRCNIIWYKAAFNGGVFDPRETVWAFGGAEKRHVAPLGSGTDFEPGVAQNWAQFLVSEKSDEANLLKRDGEPGRTRTCNPLLNPEMLCSWFLKHFLASSIIV